MMDGLYRSEMPLNISRLEQVKLSGISENSGTTDVKPFKQVKNLIAVRCFCS